VGLSSVYPTRGIAKRPSHDKQPTPRKAYIASRVGMRVCLHEASRLLDSVWFEIGDFLLRIEAKTLLPQCVYLPTGKPPSANTVQI